VLNQESKFIVIAPFPIVADGLRVSHSSNCTGLKIGHYTCGVRSG
jgi:hypothetical protein